MAKNKTISSVILWSVISAAFIGPGTVTTAASAGSLFHLDLLWAVVFATIGCIILQEVSGRLTIASGLTMGQAMEIKYGKERGGWLKFILGGPVVLGCAAYEAGNILGATSGLSLITSLDPRILTVVLSLISGAILWTGKKDAIGWLMTLLVTMMGVAFFALALGRPYSFTEYLVASTVPVLPPGSELLTLALVGTTIVPYNVFLGSGISKGQTVPLMRIGLTVSVIIGGLITAAILIAGTSVSSFSNFNELARALTARIGSMGGAALGIGLFAAGFSSAITSPYAASIIASTVFNWGERGQKLTWSLVLLTGVAFGISDIKPIPVILAVQALNGLVLPLLTAYLILLINDPLIIPKEHRQSRVYNVVLILIFGAVLLMGLNNIDKSVSTWLSIPPGHFGVMLLMTGALMGYISYKLFISRGKQ
jgi:manganese transport protein